MIGELARRVNLAGIPKFEDERKTIRILVVVVVTLSCKWPIKKKGNTGNIKLCFEIERKIQLLKNSTYLIVLFRFARHMFKASLKTAFLIN